MAIAENDHQPLDFGVHFNQTNQRMDMGDWSYGHGSKPWYPSEHQNRW